MSKTKDMNKADGRSPHNPPERKGERGSVMVLATIGAVALFLAAGMAIDISHFYSVKTELQNAADAAALAGASQLNSTSGGIKLAVVEATKALNKYDFKNNLSIPGQSVTFGVNLNGTYVDQASAEASPASIRFVKISVPPQNVNTTFAKLVLGNTKSISASATAGMSVGLTMNKFYTAFAFIEAAASPLQRDQVYTLSPKAYNSSSPNSYRVLDKPSGAGTDLVLTGSIHAYGYADGDYTVAKLSAGTSPTGGVSMCRSAAIGVNTRFGDYSIHPQSNATDEPPDTIVSEGITYDQYRTMQGNGTVERSNGVKNRRIITLPIATSSDYNTTTRVVTANRLGAFFIRRKIDSTCTLEVEYIGERLVVPVGTYTPGGIQNYELTVAVLYK